MTTVRSFPGLPGESPVRLTHPRTQPSLPSSHSSGTSAPRSEFPSTLLRGVSTRKRTKPSSLFSSGSSPCTDVWYLRHSRYSSSSNADGRVVTVSVFFLATAPFPFLDLLDVARGESGETTPKPIESSLDTSALITGPVVTEPSFSFDADPTGLTVGLTLKLRCPTAFASDVYTAVASTPMSSSSPLIAASSALAVRPASSADAPQFNPPPIPAPLHAAAARATATEHECVAPADTAAFATARLTRTGISRLDASDATGGEREPSPAHLASARVTARSMTAAATSSSAPVAATAVEGGSRALFVGAPFSSMRPSRYACNLRSTFFWDLVGENLWTSRHMVYGGQHVRSSTG
mmetsp:Transcript_11998/g.48147  ORF Transcript_11998/g.48147 Transcript_11998/m.48147 type:complete len:351 (+) Transcript_11998:712-1764(+)